MSPILLLSPPSFVTLVFFQWTLVVGRTVGRTIGPAPGRCFLRSAGRIRLPAWLIALLLIALTDYAFLRPAFLRRLLLLRRRRLLGRLLLDSRLPRELRPARLLLNRH